MGFSAATQDIVIDAYRIELAESEMQTVLASTYNAGYRIGMIVAGIATVSELMKDLPMPSAFSTSR